MNILRRLLWLNVCLFAAWLGTRWMFASAAILPPQSALRPGLDVLQSTSDELVIDLSTPVYTISPVSLSIGQFDRLAVPDRTSTSSEAGHPQLPLYSALIGVPPDARVDLQIISDARLTLAGPYRIAPVPAPAPSAGDLQPGQMRDVLDPTAYASAELYPNKPARIVQDGWLRDQRIVRIELYPFQYNAIAGTLIWHRNLRVRVHFYRGAAPHSVSTPVVDSPAFEPILQGSLLNYDAAKNWRGHPVLPDQHKLLTAASIISPSYKIVVDHDGIYRVTYANLLAAGMDVTRTTPSALHLTSQQQDVAIYVAGESDGTFDPGDYIEFYGQKFRGDVLAARYAAESLRWLTYPSGWHAQFNATMLEKYTDDNVYWLTTDSPGPRMGVINGTPDGASPIPSFYTTTVHAEQSKTWWSFHFTSEDTWFWDELLSPVITTRTYTTTLSAVSNAVLSATVRGDVVARNSNDDGAPDHRTQFRLNAAAAPFQDSTWDGLTRFHFEAQVPQSDLNEGPNFLTMTMIPQAALPVDRIYFDWFEIQYARLFRATNDQILFSSTATGSRQYVITNFVTGTLKIYNITNPLLPQRVLSTTTATHGGITTSTIGLSSTAPITYYVLGADMIQTPKSVSRYVPPDLLSSSNGADYIIITHNDFYTASQTLANYRSGQGYRVKVIDVADLYNLFNDGIYHPIAIKNFLAYAYSNWQAPAPSYVVLIGDGHWNFKEYGVAKYGVPPPIYMPPFLAFVDPWQGEVDSANLLASFVGDDILPDVHIGRLPVNSVAELNVIISKTLAYEQTGPQPYQARAVFVAELPDGAGDFEAFSENMINADLPPGYQADRIYLTNYGCVPKVPCPVVQHAITTTLNQTGTFLLNYIGHASLNSWANELAFVTTNITTTSNFNKLPIVLSMDCLDGYWLFPNTPGLMETMLRWSNGGSVASFSPTGLGLATGHDSLAHGFYAAIFQNGKQRIGPAALAAKLQLYATGANTDLIDTFTVFGDPALKLPTYALAVSPSSMSLFGEPASAVTYTLRITNSSFLTDMLTLSTRGNQWPTDVVSGITLSAGASSNVVVTVTTPVTASIGSEDVVTLTIASHGDSTSAVAVLTTIDPYQTFLPLLQK